MTADERKTTENASTESLTPNCMTGKHAKNKSQSVLNCDKPN